MKIGIDLGGTKTEIMVLSDHQGEVLYRHRVDSPRDSYQATLSTIQALVETTEKQLKQRGTVGIGIPGTIDQSTGLVKNANSTWLNGHALQGDLGMRLKREVRVANCFALSEAVDGAGKNQAIVLGIILGTGSGSGLCIHGKVIPGRNGITGEWGHNPLPFPEVYRAEPQAAVFDHAQQMEVSHIYRHKASPIYTAASADNGEWPGAQCYCGKRGCIETWVSGSGLERDYYQVEGEKLSAKTIAAQAEQQHPAALRAMERYHERLAKSLAQMINIIDPHVIVLGGGMSNVASLYQEVPQRWQKYIFQINAIRPWSKPYMATLPVCVVRLGYGNNCPAVFFFSD